MSEKIQTKDKIFEVAIDLFSKKGYDGVSIREIAKNVGIKESSIYNHYSSKKSILNSILDYFIEELNKDVFSQDDLSSNLDDDLSNFYRKGSSFYKSKMENPKMMKIMRIIIIESYHNDEIKDFMKKELIDAPINGWVNIFDLMKSKRVIRDDVDSRQLAKSYYYYGMFLLINHFIFDYDNCDGDSEGKGNGNEYGQYDNDESIFIDDFFNQMEKQMDLILDSVVIGV